MGFIIGYLIRIITIPGLVLDAFVIKKMCELLDLEVMHVDYLTFESDDVAVEHEIPTSYKDTVGLTLMPFVIMTLIAIILFYTGQKVFQDIEALFIWLGISVAAHSWPNPELGSLLWDSSLGAVKQGNYLALLGVPVALLIYIARILHFFWLDVLYGVFLYYMVLGEWIN